MSFLAMLHVLRAAELAEAARHMAPGSRILEIGGGTGFQAKLLAEMGHQVDCLDVAASTYRDSRVFPVREFDGRHLPVADGSVDVVFSSNVLEHVADLPALNAEIRRVLKPGGRCVHILPSATWRLWTSLAHYPALPRLALDRAARPGGDAAAAPSSSRHLLLRALWPGRHGEHGTAVGEFRRFSRRSWRRVFEAQGFAVMEARPVGLFYTGYLLLGSRLSIAARQHLARWLGSASILYLLRPSRS